MPNIHLKQNTKKRLDEAIKFYCKARNIDESICQKISYDYIISEICDTAGVHK